MTWQESHLRLVGIGERSARFRDLTLSFTQDGDPVESVIWLPNGGGKSSMMSLRSAVVLPNARDFTGAGRDDAGEKRPRRLDDYVGNGDTSHTVIGWTADDPQSLFRAPKRLLTGAVYEWPGRQRPADGEGGGLGKLWWRAVPKAGLLDIDDIPVRGSSLLTMTQFKARMVELNTEHPELQIQFFVTQSEWEKELNELQIDTQLARYQAKMNTSEGGIARVFKFGTTQDFINLVVDVICPPKDAADVSGVLNQHAANLFRRPQLLAEKAFLTQARDVLADLRDWQQLVDDAAHTLRGAKTGAARARISLHRARNERQTQAVLANTRAEAHGEEELDANRARRRIDRQRTELRRLAANARLEQAQDALSHAHELQNDARQQVATWSVAQHLATALGYHARAQEVLELLKPERSERDALRAAHDLQAHAVRELLRQRADEHDAQEKQSRTARELAAQRSATLAEELAAARDDLILAQGEQAKAKARIEAHTAALAAARTDEILTDGELPADAAARHAHAAEAARLQADALRTASGTHRNDAREMRTRAEKNKKRHNDLDVDAARLRDVATTIDARRSRFASDPRLVALAEADAVDPWADAPRLRSALSESIRDSRARALTQAVEAASDDRLVAAVDSGGYLPSPTATEAVLDVLRAGGIIAESAWDVLTRDFPAVVRSQVASARPDIASSVVVQSDDLRARALALLASSPTSAHIPLVTIGELTAATNSQAGPAPAPAVPLHAGLHDPDVALAAADSLRGASQTRAAERARLTALADTDTRLLDELNMFLDAHPSADSLTAAAAAADAAQRELDKLAREIEDLEADTVRMWEQAETLAEQARDLDVQVNQDEHRAKTAARLAAAALDNEQHATAAESATRLIGELTPRISRLTAAVTEANVAASSHEQTRREAERRASDARTAIARITVLDDAARPDPDALAVACGDGLTQAQTRLEMLARQWESASSESVLEERLRNFETLATNAVAEAEAAVGRFDGDKRLVREQADALSRGHSPEVCSEHLASSRDHLEAQVVRVAEASSALQQAKDKVSEVGREVSRAGRLDIDESVRFESAEQAEEEALTLDLEHSAAQSRESAARDAKDNQRRRAAELEGDAEQLRHLTTSLPEGTVDNDDLIEAFTGTMSQAHELVERTRLELARAEQEAADAEAGRQDVTFRAVKVATQPAYQGLTLAIRDRLAEGEPRALGKMAAGYIEEVDTRLDRLEELITQVEQDKDRVTSVVKTKVRELLNGISGAARASVLPAGLGDMSGNQFVTIRFDSPSDEELTSRVAQEVLQMLGNAGSSVKNLPTGETLRKCVHAAVGPRKFSVSVLKPNEHMVAQRVPVVDVARFSDGEKLTTCVLLFCAFARMRRRSNTAGTATGTLMLDNPFGQASNAQLVALQLAVAKAQQVHLVYATGLEDMGALAQFRRLIRLRNRKVTSGNGFVQPEGQRRTGEVTGVTVSRPDAPAATWQPDPQTAPA